MALNNDTLSVGNIVQNSRVVAWSGKLNFTSLYNKVPYLKRVNKKYGNARISRSRSNVSAGGKKTVKKENEEEKEGDKKERKEKRR